MSYPTTHQDIGVTLAMYAQAKRVGDPKAASKAFLSIIDELSCRGWFERFPKSLPREVRTFFYVLHADNQINNGGFAQYFFNGHGEHAEEAVKAFKEIGAPKTAATLQFVMLSFPQGKYPKTVDEYDELLEKHGEQLEFLNDENLNQAYGNLGEDVEELIVLYVKKHFDKFGP